MRSSFAAALFAGASAAAAQEVWISSQGGNWSAGVNWLDGTAPAPGGGDTQQLTFRGTSNFGTVATNDLGTFRLNELVLDRSGGLFSLASTAGSELQFVGANPLVETRGSASSEISSPTLLDSVSGTVRIGGTGRGSLTLSGGIRESTSPQALLMDATGARITLKGSNTFSGGVTLESGTLSIGSSNGLGTGTFNVLGGALQVENGVAVNNPVSLSETLVVTGVGTTGGTLSGAITGQSASAGLALRGGNLRISGPTTFTGLTTIEPGFPPAAADTVMRLTDAGTLQSTSGIRVRDGGYLLIDASSQVNRIGDTVPVLLQSGRLSLFGIDQATTETVGTLSVSGYSTVTLGTTAANAATVLSAAEFNRVDRGTVRVRGTSLGNGAGSTGSRLLLGTVPAGMTGGEGAGALSSIVPWAIGDLSSTGSGSTLVTYSPSAGLRPLLTSEYATWGAATPQSNVRLTSATSLGAVSTINALVLAGGSLTGGGALSIASGTILAANNSSIFPALNFGSAEANIFTIGSLGLSGSISGTGGLTKSGAGTLTLLASNFFTGPLTINAGSLSFSTPNQLGADSSPIVLGGDGAALSYTGSVPFSLNRGLQLGSGISDIQHTANGGINVKFTIAGIIAGEGGLRLNATNSQATRVFELTGANTYTGPTRLTGMASAVIASDSALGNGGTLELATSGTLSLTGDWQTNRAVVLTGGGSSPLTSRINTDAFTASLDGPVAGASALVKSGAGTLKLRGENDFTGSVRVDAGTLELSGMGAVRSANWTLQPGAALKVDNTFAARDGRIGHGNAIFTLNENRISLTAHAQTSATETWSRVSMSGTNTITLSAPGTAGIVLKLTAITGTGPSAMLLVRGDNLGGAPQGGWTRIVPQSTSVASGGATGLDFAPGIYLADPVTGLPSGFVLNDRTTDSAGPIGLRGVRLDEFAAGTIQNASNGGTTPTTAHVLVSGPVIASGTANTVQTITLQSGGTLTLANNQTLTVESGSLFAHPGGTGSITGGIVDLGHFRGQVYTAGDLRLGSGTVGTGTLVKLGPSALTFGGAAQHANTDIREGAARITQGGLLAGSITLNGGTALAVESPTASVGSLLGSGAVTISSGNRLTIGTADAVTTFSGVISGDGQLALVGGPSGEALRTLSGANTFTGGATLQGGRLVIGNTAALGTGSVTMAGGTLVTTSPIAISNPFVLNQTLLFDGSHLLTLKPSSVLTGSGDIEVRGRGGLTLEATSAHTGETRTAFIATSQISIREPLTLTGAAGSISASPAVRLAPGSTLVLENAAAASGVPAGRIGDSALVELAGAQLRLNGNSTTAVQETIGTLRGSGFSTVTIAPAGGNSNTTLSSGALERNGRGTFLFRQPTGSQITFTAAPSGLVGGGGTDQNVSILPYVIGDATATGNGSGLVTFEPGVGLRLLTTTEYSGDFVSATASNNVRLQSQASLETDVTVNALVLGSIRYNNPGTTHIAGGALVKTGPAGGTVGGSISFGTAEGNVFVSGDTQSTLDLLGTISGSNGLTKSGYGLLRLSGDNTFTGPLTINAGILEFTQIAALGGDSSPIVLHGGEQVAHLRYGGSGSATITRGLNISDGMAALSSVSQVTISGNISGSGGISISPQTAADGEVVLTGTNTYAGPTIVNGDLAIQSDASLGANSRLILTASSGTVGGLRLLGPWNTGRTVEVNGFSARINTNGFDAHWDGHLVGSSPLAKTGAGTLTLTADSSFSGSLKVEGGVLRLMDSGRLASSALTLSGGELLLDNTVTPVSGRLSKVVETIPGGGRFTLLGHATQPISENLGTLSYNGIPAIFTLTAPGTATTSLQLSHTPGSGNSVLIRGDRLGEPAGDAGVTRVRFIGTPSLQGGLLPGVIVDHSITGFGNSFATYDTSSDLGGGVLGVRALRANEYVSGPVIQTVVNGGTVAPDANYLLNGATSAIGTVTQLNSITFSSASKLSLTGSQVLDFSGAVGLLAQRGSDAVVEGGVIRYGKPSLIEPLRIYGDGNLTFSGSRIQNPPDIGNRPLHKSGRGTLTFKDSIVRNDLQISDGTVRLEGNSDLIASQIDLGESGTLEVGSPIARIGPLMGTGTVRVGNNALHVYSGRSFAGEIVGSGRLESRGTSFVLESPVAFTGTIGVSRDPARSYQTEGISGIGFFFTKEGSALAANGVSVGPGAGFAVDARFGAQRIGAVPVAINGGNFTFRSELLDGVRKLNLGPVSAQGFAGLTASQLYSGTGAHLEVERLDRVERGIFSVSLDPSPSTGKQSRITVAEGLESVLVGAGTTATNRPVLPFAVYSSPGYGETSLLTYTGSGGLRLLNSETDYSRALVAGDNVLLSGSHEIPAAGINVNTLSMSGTVIGSGALQIESGVLLGNGTISSPLNFGAVEGIVYPTGLVVTGVVSGANGLTVTNIMKPTSYGKPELELRGQNTFTGPLTLNGGMLRFSSLENLGPEQSQIISNDGSLIYTGDQALTLTRSMSTRGFQARLETAGTGRFTLDAPISGPGGLRIRGDVALTGINTYEGYTEVEGRLTISSDAALGSGPLRIGRSSGVPPLTNGTLALAGDWITDRIVQIGYDTSAMRIDTAGFNATLNGVLTQDIGQSAPELEKIGAGTLILRNADGYSGGLTIEGGTVTIDGAMGASHKGLSIGINGRLTGIGSIPRAVTVQGALDPGLTTPGLLTTGSLAFAEGSTLALQFASAAQYDRIEANGSVSLNGATQLVLDFLFDPTPFVDSFILLANDGTDVIAAAGRFTLDGNALEDGEVFFSGAHAFSISYTGGTGNDVVLSAVPEPASAGLLAFGCGALSLTRFRRRSRLESRI